MRIALMCEPQQGMSYEDLLRMARATEAAGFEAFYRSDHYTSFPGAAGLPTTDAWVTLAGLARETDRIGLGTMVSPVTFRHPGLLAKMAVTADHMSGGRIEVGLGAGWNEAEHAEYGFDFPDLRTRVDMLAEQLAIVHGLWTEPDGWTYEGRFWRVRGSRFVPRPLERAGRRHPNLIVGGGGRTRTAHLAARYADEFNFSSGDPDAAHAAFERVRAACVEVGRDPASLTYSTQVGVLVATSPDELRQRTEALLRLVGRGGGDAAAFLAERRSRWIIGTPDEALERVAAFGRAGAQRLVLQTLLPRDLEMLRLIGEALIPQAATM